MLQVGAKWQIIKEQWSNICNLSNFIDQGEFENEDSTKLKNRSQIYGL